MRKLLAAQARSAGVICERKVREAVRVKWTTRTTGAHA
jgi:hypothetical protein